MAEKIIKYRFEGVDRNGKKIAGFVFAETEGLAREKLKANGYAILSLEPYAQGSQANSDFQRFDFQGHKTEGTKTIHGTIEAKDVYAAYKKLRLEYDLFLEYIVPSSMDVVEKNKLKTQGIPEQLEEQLQIELAEGGVSQKKIKKQNPELIAESKRKQMDFYRKEIEALILKVQKILTEYGPYIPAKDKRNIQERIDILSRLRQSNSVEHLKSLMTQLVEKLHEIQINVTQQQENTSIKPSDTEQKKDPKASGTKEASMPPIPNTNPESIKKISPLADISQIPDTDRASINPISKEDFEKEVENLTAEFQTGLSNLKIDLAALSTEKIKQTVQKINPLSNIADLVYWTCVFLFCFCLLFWFLNGLKIIVFFGDAQSLFYFQSAPFWFVTGLSGLISVLFGLRIFYPETIPRKKQWIFYAMTLGILFFYILEFPVFFRWT